MRISITGCGIVNACGNDYQAVAQSLLSGHSGISAIRGFPTETHPVKVAGIATRFSAHDAVHPRFVAKTDRFTHFALAASEAAMMGAGIEMKLLDRSRAGIWFGNNSGGWDICERGFKEFYRQGVEMINPWQATAWFPAAPQGFVSIRYELTGCSKSFVADRATGLVAVIHGARSLMRGENDLVLAGGTEAPVTSFGATCYYETGEVADVDPARPVYRTLGNDVGGLVLGEGAAVLTLETTQALLRRQVSSLADIVGVAITTDPGAVGYVRLAYAIRQALAQAQLTPEAIDIVFGEGNGIVSCNAAEEAALWEVFSATKNPPLYTSIKGYTGHMYGGSGATEMIAALIAAQYGKVPATLHAEKAQPFWRLPIATEVTTLKPRHALIIARAREGVNAALILQFSH